MVPMHEHRCPQNPHQEIYVLYGPSIDDDWSDSNWGDQWVLRVDRIAREQDVIDGQAEQVGDRLHRDEFVIDFFPFCGISLKHRLGLNDGPS